MKKSQGEKNKELYNYFYNKGKKDQRDVYTVKNYNKNFTDEDKKKVESSFAFKKKPMTQKHILMFVLICILFLLYGNFALENQDNITNILFICLFFLSFVGVYHNVKGKFYILLLVLITLTLLIVSGLAKNVFDYGVNKIISDKKGIRNNLNKNNISKKN